MTVVRLFAIATLLFVGASIARSTQSATSQPAPQPVPLLTPEEEAATFNLPPGFRAEVVASEPMVEHPVAIAFDPRGRLWVAEMRNYMPDVDGWGESKPTGRISILEDTDGDGRMDKATVFLDKLVLPRAIGFAHGGVLVGSPTKLFFCRDTNGDDKADVIETIATDFGAVENPEMSANGLLYNLDNWIYCANYDKRLQIARDGRAIFSPTPAMGEFGISRDDSGRLFFDTNSDYLRGSLVPPHYSSQNPRNPIEIADTRIAIDQNCWPAHATTVNRGYREGFLRDGRLKEFTAACGPCIYRGNLFPAEFYGNAFACEASANLVRRSILHEKDAQLSVTNPYEKREFIASTYERFRPVNLSVGPEGALYIVDMHHGLIQHKMSLTDYGKAEYLKKQLNKHLLTGRIFRIVPDGPVPAAHPRLDLATSVQLVDQLTHPNAWWRETAQRLLVERDDTESVAPLQKLALKSGSAATRLEALWTLQGMNRLDSSILIAAMGDADGKVRANAIRLAEEQIAAKTASDGVRRAAEKLAGDSNADVRLQFVLSMSALREDEAVARVLRDAGDNAMLREAAISGLAGREIAMIGRILADPSWSTQGGAKASVLTDVARSIAHRDDPKDLLSLVDLIGAQPPEREWQQIAMLEGLPAARKDDFGASKPHAIDHQPEAIERLRAASDKSLTAGAVKIAALFDWPGKPVPPRPKVVPLTVRQQQLFEIGRTQFALICAQCHKADATGQEGKAPPLLNSPWALGPPSRVIRIVLHGARGPIPVGERTFNLEMPSLKALSDEQIAGVLTFIRRSWGHEASAIEPAAVQSIRDWTQARRDGWTAQELLHLK